MERAKRNLMQKIRRFESLARLADCDDQEALMVGSIAEDYDDDDDDEDDGGKELSTSHEGGEEEVDEITEKAWQLLSHVKATGATESCRDISVDQLLVDFFSDELTAQKHENCTRNEFDDEVVSRAASWINGADGVLMSWEEQCRREAYVRDMDRAGKWSKLEEEREELGVEFAGGLLGLLVDELLLELISG